MKVLTAIWADPAMSRATIFKARMLSERGIPVDPLYRTPNSQLNVVNDVDFVGRSRMLPVGGRCTGWRDRMDYAKFVTKANTLAWREKADAVIGCNTLGTVAAFSVNLINSKSGLIYHNFCFDVSTKGVGSLGRLVRWVELIAARRSEITIFPAQEVPLNTRQWHP